MLYPEYKSCYYCEYAKLSGRYYPERYTKDGWDQEEFPEFDECTCDDEMVKFYLDTMDRIDMKYAFIQRRNNKEVISTLSLEFIAEFCPKFKLRTKD